MRDGRPCSPRVTRRIPVMHPDSTTAPSADAEASVATSETRVPPPFRLYNTLTRSLEPFEPADGRTVRMYTCGPTVYNPAHLGNFRTFLFEDLMRRVFTLRGWQVHHV